MAVLVWLVPAATLAGCVTGEPAVTSTDSPPADSADAADVACARVASVDPADGAVGVYYRDPIQLAFDAQADSASIGILGADGAPVASETAWSEDSLVATVFADLAPATSHTVRVETCGEVWSSSLTTSELGSELTLLPSDLIGRTYVFSLSEARLSEPSVLEPLVDAFFTAPLLFMVVSADTEEITWEGALGNSEGEQIADQPTWSFPAADFTSAPYFAIEVPSISFDISGYPLPVENFSLSGDFTSDATAVAGARASGFADTRGVAALFGDSESAACDVVAENGVYCEECDDGSPFCLRLAFDSITAYWREGLTVEHMEPG